jgi:superfamily II DNA or RNA helicase
VPKRGSKRAILSLRFRKSEYSLMPYQEEAHQFISKNLRVLVTLPAGSGKTLLSLYSVDTLFPEKRRILFVTETVVIDDIFECIEKFFFDETFFPICTIGYGPDSRQEMYQQYISGELDLIITTYATIRNDFKYFLTLFKHFRNNGISSIFVIDEASAVRNEDSQNHQCCTALGKAADLVIALTATPIATKLGDIDNVIRCVTPSNYMTRDEFRSKFEINLLDTDGFLFKASNTKLYVNSEEDETPARVVIKGQAYFRVPWKFGVGAIISKLVIHTPRKISYTNFNQAIKIPPLRPIDFSTYSIDISPSVKFATVTEKGVGYLMVPITRAMKGGPTRFRSINLTLTVKLPGEREREIDTVISYSYEISGTIVGYKNLSKYREMTRDVLFSLAKVGYYPPTNVIKRYYTTDKKTKQAVASVYEDAEKRNLPASVARIITASSAPGLFLEDTKYINNKTKTLIDDLKSEISNAPILVFSPYVNVLEYLSKVLVSVGIEHTMYHGQLSDEEKSSNKKAFKSGRSNILLMSLAAAKGVNLQRARTLCLFDHPFTSENFTQLAGRISRLGSLHKDLLVHSYQSESGDAIENCLYYSIMLQLNFIMTVEPDFVDKDLVDSEVVGSLNPEDADKYMLTRLGYSKSYYCNN